MFSRLQDITWVKEQQTHSGTVTLLSNTLKVSSRPWRIAVKQPPTDLALSKSRSPARLPRGCKAAFSFIYLCLIEPPTASFHRDYTNHSRPNPSACFQNTVRVGPIKRQHENCKGIARVYHCIFSSVISSFRQAFQRG